MVSPERSLDRFRQAQENPTAGFESALQEIRSGGKRGHWIWYVFPQMLGLGSSPMSQAYGIADEAEAEAYLCDPVLGPRLMTIAVAVADQVRRGASLQQILASEIDVLKLVSSLTLFGSVAKGLAAAGFADAGELARVADSLLQAARAEGYRPCAFTLARLSHPLPFDGAAR
jgi:uncharacterized protein (DUF1810 family)